MSIQNQVKMSSVPAERPTEATMQLLEHVTNSVRLTFADACKHMSLLQGKSVEEFCTQENVHNYINNVFTAQDKETLVSGEPEQWDMKLQYKVLKFTSGLADRDDTAWDSQSDRLEYHITFIYKEMEQLAEAAAFTNLTLSSRLRTIQESLIRVLEQVEEKKQIELGSRKQEVLEEPQCTTQSSPVKPSVSNNVRYTYTILIQHVIHRMFAMTYEQLNCLEGGSVSSFLERKYRCKYKKCLSCDEVRLVEAGTAAQNMPIQLLFKLLQRVCDLTDHRRWVTSEGTLGHCLYCLKKDHKSALMLDEQACADQCHQLHTYLHSLLGMVAQQRGKSMKEILRVMPDEPMCLDESFQELSQVDAPGKQPCDPAVSPTTSQTTQQQSSPATPSPAPQQSPVGSLPSLSQVTFDVQPEEVNVSCWFKALRSGGPAVKALAIAIGALNGNISNVGKKELNCFTAKEQNKLQVNVNLADPVSLYMEQDITLLYKLARYGCKNLAAYSDPIWNTQGNTIEYYLHQLKDVRNDLAHEVKSITKEELKKKVENLQNLLENILQKASAISNKDLQTVVEDMKKELRPLQDPPATCIDRKSYEDSMKRLREDLKIRVVGDAETELHAQYQNPSAKYASPVTWCYKDEYKNITIDKVFGDLEFIKASSIEGKTIYSLEEMLLLQEQDKMGSRIIIVQGAAGTGKTSMCQYITHIWSSDFKPLSLQTVDMLIHIKCRYITCASASLVSYLKVFLPETFKNIDKEDVIPLMQEPRVMFLVDGYDEAGPDAKRLLQDILISLPEARMIITSKPQWAPKLESKINGIISSSCAMFTVVGFKRETRDQFIRKFFASMLTPQQMSTCDQFLAYLSDLGEQLEALTELPLTLALLAMLWIQDMKNARKTKTVTQLYQTLTSLRLQRLCCQLDGPSEDDCWDWMFALGKLAWKNLQANQHYISENDRKKLRKKAKDLGVDDVMAISSLLRGETQTDLAGSTEIWTFTHNYQQEYLAAEYIVEEITMNDMSVSDILGFKGEDGEDKKLQRLMQVVEFITDLLSYKKEMTRTRARYIVDLALVQAPWSFAAVKRMSPALFKNNQEFREEFKMMWQKIEIADYLDGYDPQCVKWVLENTSLGVPSCILFKNLISDVMQMHPLLQLLEQRSCSSKVLIDVDQAVCMSDVINFIQGINKSSVHFIFHTWNTSSLRELVNRWPWTRPLHLSFPGAVFPLLWWELLIYLVQEAVPTLSTVSHNNSDRRCVRLVEEGARLLEIESTTDSQIQDGEVVICPQDPPSDQMEVT